MFILNVQIYMYIYIYKYVCIMYVYIIYIYLFMIYLRMFTYVYMIRDHHPPQASWFPSTPLAPREWVPKNNSPTLRAVVVSD